MKNTILFTMIFMMSFSLVGQSTNVVEHFGYQGTSFINNGLYVDNVEITQLPPFGGFTFTGIDGETITVGETVNNFMEVSVLGPWLQTVTISVAKNISDGYTNLSVQMDFYIPNTTVDLIEYDINENTINTYTNINTSKFDISNSTDSIELIFNVQLLDPYFGQGTNYFMLESFKLFGDLITNIQENITNNFNVYAYNKNLVVKTTEFEDYALTVYNLSGQEVFTKNTNGNQDIPLTLVTGMYIVNINNGKESFNQKVVVQ